MCIFIQVSHTYTGLHGNTQTNVIGDFLVMVLGIVFLSTWLFYRIFYDEHVFK